MKTTFLQNTQTIQRHKVVAKSAWTASRHLRLLGWALKAKKYEIREQRTRECPVQVMSLVNADTITEAAEILKRAELSFSEISKLCNEWAAMRTHFSDSDRWRVDNCILYLYCDILCEDLGGSASLNRLISDYMNLSAPTVMYLTMLFEGGFVHSDTRPALANNLESILSASLGAK